MTAYSFSQLIDFTRTSSATFVGSNGLIQTTPQSRNLLLWTQDFDNAYWVKGNATVAANSTVAPDGTPTADTLTVTNTTVPSTYRNLPTTAAAHTFSAYIKQGNTAFSEIELVDEGTVANRVRLTYATGVLSVVAGSPTGTATNVGNGWWRVTITYTFPAAGNDTVVIYPGTTTGVIGNFCFIWGAQLEQASTASDYTRNVGGLFPPRFDYDPVTLAPRGILIEEQRVNVVLYSEQFDNAAWSKANATITANATTSPDGTANADKLVETATTGLHYAADTNNRTGTFTMSAYIKAAERTSAAFGLASNSSGVVFNLSNGTVTSTGVGWSNSVITPAGNGWYRCSATTTLAADWIYISPNTANSYLGVSGSGIFIWGAQIEAGAFATSYIPTVASQVTRTADQASIVAPMFAPWYNQSEGTFVASFDMAGGSAALSSNRAVLSAREGATSSHNIYNGSGQVTGWTVLSGADQAFLTTGAVAADTVTSIAYAYKANDFAASRNGGTAVTDTSGTLPTPTVLGIGGNTAGSLFLSGHIRNIRFYPVRLSDLQLQALTQ